MLLSTFTLWKRELSHFLRERTRIIGALGTPFVFWLLIGSGFGASFQPPGSIERIDYLEYLFPGTIVLMLLFTSIFSTISIIEDRREGFLQSVLVAPVPRLSVILGNVLGGATIALLQGLLFLVAAPLLGISLTVFSVLAITGILFLLAFGLTSLGFFIAWRIDSSQGYHAIMTLLLMPMWLLSGALFPSVGAPGWLRWVITFNPLAYGLGALRRCLYFQRPFISGEIPPMIVCLAVITAFGLISTVAALYQVHHTK